MSERNLSIRRVLLPKDTNHRGEVFGGAILAEIDLAGVVEARRHTRHDVATVFVNGVEFRHPIHIGDVVSFYTTLVKLGTTSITVRVEVEASRDGLDAETSVTATEIVYVAVAPGPDGKLHKTPIV
jgi:acyl-CoA thioesterase YciA